VLISWRGRRKPFPEHFFGDREVDKWLIPSLRICLPGTWAQFFILGFFRVEGEFLDNAQGLEMTFVCRRSEFWISPWPPHALSMAPNIFIVSLVGWTGKHGSFSWGWITWNLRRSLGAWGRPCAQEMHSNILEYWLFFYVWSVINALYSSCKIFRALTWLKCNSTCKSLPNPGPLKCISTHRASETPESTEKALSGKPNCLLWNRLLRMCCLEFGENHECLLFCGYIFFMIFS